jgi:cysteine-rich CPXCG protein
VTSGFQCAGCGEWNATQVDSSAGTRQTYIEDCQVCCKANVLRITWDRTAGEFVIESQLE